MKTTLILALSLTAAAPAFAQAQTAPAQTAPAQPATGTTATVTAATPTIGATVYDPAGTPAGTIKTVDAQSVLIATGTNDVAVPLSAIGSSPKGVTVTLTRAQLDAAAAEAKTAAAAQVKAQLVPGTSVRSLNGSAVLGTIKATDAEFVTLTTAKGDVKLPVTGFAAGPNGVILGLTAAQFDAVVSGAK